MAAIAKDGYFPSVLGKRINHIPVFSIISMTVLAFFLVLAGSLEVILEFGSVTFLLVSLLMAYANFKIRNLTNSSLFITVLSFLGLLLGAILILYYEFNNQPQQLAFIIGLYALLTLGSWLFSRKKIVKLTINNQILTLIFITSKESDSFYSLNSRDPLTLKSIHKNTRKKTKLITFFQLLKKCPFSGITYH